jgi:hypothetical protein
LLKKSLLSNPNYLTISYDFGSNLKIRIPKIDFITCGRNIQTKPSEVILKKRTKEKAKRKISMQEERSNIDYIS